MRQATFSLLLAIPLAGCAGAPPRADVAAEPAAPAPPAPPVVAAPAPAPSAAPREAPSLLPAPAPEAPSPLPPPLAAAPSRPRSAVLKSGFHNPLPGGVFAGYQADTGLDIAGVRLPVHAIASGTLDYSEAGHTLWTGPRDTPFCVRFELDTPIPWNGRQVTHVYYAHLSRLETVQREGETPRRHIEAGELVGISGVARGSPHLHIGLLLDGDTSQRYWGTFLLADEIRKVLGGYRNGDRL